VPARGYREETWWLPLFYNDGERKKTASSISAQVRKKGKPTADVFAYCEEKGGKKGIVFLVFYKREKGRGKIKRGKKESCSYGKRGGALFAVTHDGRGERMGPSA